MWILDLFRYLRLKVQVSIFRLVVAIQADKLKFLPDSVLQIPSRDKGRSIKAHVYSSSQSTPNTPSPVLVNFHGSGFVFPMHGTDNIYCHKIASSTPYSVLDIQYRLAPENPWPACHNDAEDVVKYVLSRPDIYSKSQIAISGFSAGGNMACVAAALTFPKDTFNALIAFYPPTNIAIAPEKKMPPDQTGNPVPASMEHMFNACYLLNGTDPADPRVSPALGPVDNYPANTMFVTCARDRLCSETETLAKRVEDASDDGRKVVLRRMDKCGHAWDKSVAPGSYKEAKRDEAYDLAVDTLRNTMQ